MDPPPLLSPPDLAPPVPSDATPGQCIAMWLDLLNAFEHGELGGNAGAYPTLPRSASQRRNAIQSPSKPMVVKRKGLLGRNGRGTNVGRSAARRGPSRDGGAGLRSAVRFLTRLMTDALPDAACIRD